MGRHLAATGRFTPVVPFVLLAVLAGLYLAFPTRTFECDAVIYASGAYRQDPAVTHYAGHLGFSPLVRAAADLGRNAEPALHPFYILQYLSMAAALLGVFLLYRLLVRIGLGPVRATLFAAVFAAGYSFWHFALQAESHILSTFFLIAFLSAFSRVLSPDDPSEARRRGVGADASTEAPTRTTDGRRVLVAAAGSGLLLAAATLMHQKNILVTGAIFLGLVARDPRPRRFLPPLLVLGAVYGVVVAAAYAAVGFGALGHGGFGEFYTWIRGLSTWGGWGNWQWKMIPAAIVGIARSFAGSHFALGIAPVRGLADRLFPYASWDDEMAAAAVVPGALRWVLLFLEAAVLIVAAVALVRALRSAARGAARHPAWLAFLGGWILTLLVFNAWWAPERAEFWIDFFLPLVVFVAFPWTGWTARESAAGPRPAPAAGLAFVAAGLLVVNLLGSIAPQSLPTVDSETTLACAIEAAARPGDVLLADIPFEGRASRYVDSLEKIDLLAFCSLDALDAAPSERATIGSVAGGVAGCAARIDSLLASQSARGRAVYLLEGGASPDPSRRAAYARLVDAVRERFDASAALAVRAPARVWRVEPHEGAMKEDAVRPAAGELR